MAACTEVQLWIWWNNFEPSYLSELKCYLNYFCITWKES